MNATNIMKSKKNIVLIVAVVLIIGSIAYLESLKAHRGAQLPAEENAVTASSTVHTSDYADKTKKYPLAQELVSPDGFINTNGVPITLSSLVGKKVILVDFWAYSCINCQRTIPYLNSWYEKYKDQGLEIIGVHTPEFDFEKKIDNVRAAVGNFNIMYPVVLDNQYLTWDAYNNQYWPEEYLIDINGLVVDRKIGEGGYADTEKEIQNLLAERKQALNESGTIPTDITNIDESIHTQSPETYFGFARNTYLANGAAQTPGTQTLTLPANIELNQLYLDGAWNFQSEYAENASVGAKIAFTYNAKNVYFVASSKNPDAGVSITVLRDGKPVGTFAGADVNASGHAMIKEARLYKLISEQSQGTHTIEIIVNGAGLDAFTFTFG
jgi:thiol-disulfide isomerase/thioredoxin